MKVSVEMFDDYRDFACLYSSLESGMTKALEKDDTHSGTVRHPPPLPDGTLHFIPLHNARLMTSIHFHLH